MAAYIRSCHCRSVFIFLSGTAAAVQQSRLTTASHTPVELTEVGTKLQVQFFGERYPLTVAREPLYDPGT
jgi:hypothetical protein